jgi:hypothetical protein
MHLQFVKKTFWWVMGHNKVRHSRLNAILSTVHLSALGAAGIARAARLWTLLGPWIHPARPISLAFFWPPFSLFSLSLSLPLWPGKLQVHRKTQYLCSLHIKLLHTFSIHSSISGYHRPVVGSSRLQSHAESQIGIEWRGMSSYSWVLTPCRHSPHTNVRASVWTVSLDRTHHHQPSDRYSQPRSRACVSPSYPAETASVGP